MKLTIVKVASFAVISLLSTGCAAEKIYALNQQTLAGALTSIESGNLASAEGSAKAVLTVTGSVKKEYSVQRFFAQYLLARLHMEAALGTPFLTESKPASVLSLGGGSTTRPSPISHLVATSYHASYSMDWYKGAVGKPLIVDKVSLLPPELEALGFERANVHLLLCLLAVYSQLGFEEVTIQVLDALEATNLASLNKAVEMGEASANMKPWIYRTMWDRYKKSDPRTAFQFAIRTLETAEELTEDGSNAHSADIGKWLTESPKFKFICPACDDIEIQADSPLCVSCFEQDRMNFLYVERSRSRGISEGDNGN